MFFVSNEILQIKVSRILVFSGSELPQEQEAVLQEAYPPGDRIPGGSATTRLLFPGLIVLDYFVILTYVMDTYINVFPVK